MIRTLILVCVLSSPLIAGVKTGQLLGIGASVNIEGIYTVDLDMGEATLLVPFDVNPSEGDIAIGPDGTVYAAFSGVFDQLVAVDMITGSLDYIGPFGFDDVSGLAFAPGGTLYATDAATSQLLVVDIHSGAGFALGSVFPVTGAGISFSPSGQLFGLGYDSFWEHALYTIDLDTLAVSEVGLLGDFISIAAGLTFVGDTLYGSLSDDDGDDSLYIIDPATGLVTKWVGYFEQGGAISLGGLAFLPGAGDGDRDGDVDADDVVFFEECFGPLDEPGESPYCAFLDADKDGDLDCIDWEAFIPNWTEDTEPPTFEPCDGPLPCEGDANGDGVVDPLDTGYIMSRFGCSVGTGDAECDAADVNADLVVDPLDAGYALARFGVCSRR